MNMTIYEVATENRKVVTPASKVMVSREELYYELQGYNADQIPSFLTNRSAGQQMPLIHYAAARGWLDVMQLVFDRVNRLDQVDLYDSDGYTPLLYACKYGHSSMISLLLEKNLSSGIMQGDGVAAPLFLLSNLTRQSDGRHAHLKEVTLQLVRAGANPNQVVGTDNRRAWVLGEFKVAETESLQFYNFHNPLSYAIWMGDLEVVKVLLEVGAIPDIVCLHMASAAHRVDILEALLQCKNHTWPEIEDCNLGSTTLLDAALLDSPLFGYTKRLIGTRATHEASLKHIIRLLICRCTNPKRLMSPYFMSSYLLQCCRFYITDVELFGQLLYPETYGPYPRADPELLFTAISWNQYAVVKYLIDIGCQDQNSYGFGVSHACATWPVSPAVYLNLEAHGIDFKSKQNNKAITDLETPFQMAVACQNFLVANWLFENGHSRDDIITSSTDESESCTLLGWLLRMSWSESHNSLHYLLEEYVDEPLPNFIVTPAVGRSALQEAARCSPSCMLGEQEARDRMHYLVLKYPGSRHLEYQRIDNASQVQGDTQHAGLIFTIVDGKSMPVKNKHHFKRYIENYPETKEKENNGTALHFAVRSINYPAVEVLLEAGADASAMIGMALPDSNSMKSSRGASTYAVKENCWASTVLDFATLVSDRLQSKLVTTSPNPVSSEQITICRYQLQRIQDIVILLQQKEAANSVTFLRKRKEKMIFQERREKGNLEALRMFKSEVKDGFASAWKLYKTTKREVAEHLSTPILTPESTKINFANKLLRQHRLEEALKLYLEVQEQFRVKGVKKTEQDYLILLMNIGIVYQEQGKFAEAEKLHMESLTQQEALLGSEHPTTLTAINNLGQLLIRQGKAEEAEPWCERAYSVRKKVLGPKDPETLHSLIAIGTLRLLQERNVEAEVAYEQAFRGLEVQLGLEDSRTVRAIYHLGLIYMQTQRWHEAKKMMTQAVTGRESTYGIHHVDTLDAVSQLSTCLKELGETENSITLRLRALNGYRQILPVDDAKVTDAAYKIGEIYREGQKWDEAVSMFQLALTGEEKRLGRDHTSTLVTLAKIASTYKSQGLIEEAIQKEIRVLGGYQENYEFDNEKVTHTAYRLGELYSRISKWNEAISMFQLSLRGEEERVGPEHELTLLTIRKLATAYTSQDMTGKAIQMEMRSLSGYQKNLHFDYESLTNTAYRLGRLYLKLEQWDESISMFKLALKGEEERLGRDHEATLLTIRQLALAYTSQGLMDKAIPLRLRILESKEMGTNMDDKVFLDTHWNLGVNYWSSDLAVSRFHYKTATEGYEILLGCDHKETLDGHFKLGYISHEMGDLESAELHFSKAMDGFTKTLGPENFDTLRAIDQVASVLLKVGKNGEGIRLFEENLKIREKMLGSNHPDTIKTLQNIERGRSLLREQCQSQSSGLIEPSVHNDGEPCSIVALRDRFSEQLAQDVAGPTSGGIYEPEEPNDRELDRLVEEESQWTIEILGTMILDGILTESADSGGLTPLLWAADKGYEELVLLLVQMGADIHKVDGHGRTVLHLISRADNQEVVQQLISRGALVDKKDTYGMTAFHHATIKGNVTILKILLDAMEASGKSPAEPCLELMTNEGLTLLHLACIEGHSTIAKVLLDRGASATKFDGSGCYTPLLLSAKHGHIEVLKLLLDNGVDVEDVSHDGMRALHYAAARGDADVVQFLLENNSDIEAQVLKDDWTPLFVAVNEGHIDITVILVQCGARVNAKDLEGRMPIHIAAGRGVEEIIGLLIDSNADIDVNDDTHLTPLHHAALGGHTEAAKMLLKFNALGLHAKENNGCTPLYLAAVRGHEDLVRVFLDGGAQINGRNTAGMTPLHGAALCGNDGVIRILLDRGANVSVESNEGKRAVDYAATNKHLGTILLLSLASQS